MKAKPRRGRPSIFRGMAKDGRKVQAAPLTPVGSSRFEAARKRLAKLAGWEVEDVSDRDTIEYLVRGDEETMKALKPGK